MGLILDNIAVVKVDFMLVGIVVIACIDLIHLALD
jgi:hypothetical protein